MNIRFWILSIFISFSASIRGQNSFYTQLADSDFLLTKQKIQYDPGYFSIAYPNGDLPANKGVCTDVIIRAYHKLGINLQTEIHEDMAANFQLYPNYWSLTHTDKNIDHRRVPYLMTFFARHGNVKTISENPQDYIPGDIVCWNLGGGITHIGLVARKKSADDKRYLMIHNIWCRTSDRRCAV